MPDRRGSRFFLEVLFLLMLAGALALAQLDPLEIGAVMLVGWLVVAALEWAAWHGEPHFGSGLPPRYYVPEVNLPPALPLEQVSAGYPASHHDEAPTWIASAALRAEVLGGWPHAAPAAGRAEGPTEEQDPWTIVALPGAALDELDDEPEETLDAVLVRSVQSVARYSLDPLGEIAPPRRRLRRGDTELAPALEIPARPDGIRALPGRSNRQD